MIYNCILSRWSSPPSLWDTFRKGNNLFTTTLSVLVSAVQKLSAVTVIPNGLRLYRGTGGLVTLPQHFTTPDEHNCKGMTDWGFMSSSTNKSVAVQYSGVVEGRPHAMVLEIEPGCADRGAVVSEFSQYPKESETLFLPMSYVAQSGAQRLERTNSGVVAIIPVRVSVNLKAERLEQLEEKKKSIHLSGFEFRLNELRQKLLAKAQACGAEARLSTEKNKYGHLWQREYSVGGYIDDQAAKVEEVLARHRVRAAADYSDDAVYRSLVSESLEAARMAESALLWWLMDEEQYIHIIDTLSLMEFQREFESFLRLRYSRAADSVSSYAAAVDLCMGRNLMLVDANESDDNGEARLIALAARGGSADDVMLLVAARADVDAVAEHGRSAMYWAARQGHAEVIEALARAGANCNQADDEGRTPVWTASLNGHVRCVEVLIRNGADLNKAKSGEGTTPLYVASCYGHLNVVDALLRAGADFNQATAHGGATPLIIAVEFLHSRIVDALLSARADVNKAKADDGTTPLYVACQDGQLHLVEALLLAGSDINKATSDTCATPLYAASEAGHSNVVEALLRHGADVNKAMHDGRSPLLIASWLGHTACVESLVQARADLHLKYEGQTPVSVAYQQGHTGIYRMLRAAAADQQTEEEEEEFEEVLCRLVEGPDGPIPAKK
jgi:ankyrin repeat protein